MIQPSKAQFLELAKSGNLVPVWKELLADQETPVSAYERVRKALRRRDSTTHTYLLESVEGGENVGRYSFIGGKPRAIVRAWGKSGSITLENGEVRPFENRDPLEVLKEFMSQYQPVPNAELPRFTGGAVGFLGYDAVSIFEPRVKTVENDPLNAPDMVFMVTDAIIVFDRVMNRLKIISNAHIDGNPEAAYEAACEQIKILEEAMLEPVERIMIDTQTPVEDLEPTSNFTQAEFEANVEKVKEYVHAGDIIQTVISQRFEVKNESDSLDIYRVLRSINPSPYMFCLDMDESALVGASPEIHVRCEDRHVEVRPIAGTRVRGATPEADDALAAELMADPKERAEHIMLVDLGRNDAGRVCEYGSVEVPELMVIERYSHVMHIVSDVTGTLKEESDAYDLIRATFPAGTVSGAPKIRAMEIISELENLKRGPYAGLVGYIDFNGNLDTCITIRTAVLDGDKAYVQAGAGIVADSVARSEFEETQNKARGMIRALSIAQQFRKKREQQAHV